MNDLEPADQNVTENFRESAHYLGIPEGRWNESSVREFIELYTEVKNLQRKINNASQGGSSDEEITAGTTSLMQRYGNAELLLRAIAHILEEGSRGRAVSPDYLLDKVGNAVDNYGVKVVKR